MMVTITTRLLGYTTAGAAVLAMTAFAWGLRVDHLRAVYKSRWETVTQEYAVFRTAIIDKTAEAIRAQKAVNQQRENEWKEKADAAENNVDELRDRLRAALMHKSRGRGAGGTAGTAAQDNGSSIPEEMSSATAGVAGSVSISIETLSGLAAYAIGAHDWAVSIEQENTPEK